MSGILTGIRGFSPKPLTNIIGPEYSFSRSTLGTNYIDCELKNLGECSLKLVHMQINKYPDNQLLIKDGFVSPIAEISWDAGSSKIENIRIFDAEFRGTGISDILGNIALRSFLENCSDFEKIHSSKIFFYDDSNINVVGWFSKFGINHYRKDFYENIASTLWDKWNYIQVKNVEFSDEKYLQYHITSWKNGCSDPTYKLFLLDDHKSDSIYHDLAIDRDRLKHMILDGLIAISAPLFLMPGYASELHNYAKKLPKNIFD